MTLYNQNDEPVECPVCHESDDVDSLDDSLVYDVGIYVIHDITQILDNVVNKYVCNRCNYRF